MDGFETLGEFRGGIEASGVAADEGDGFVFAWEGGGGFGLEGHEEEVVFYCFREDAETFLGGGRGRGDGGDEAGDVVVEGGGVGGSGVEGEHGWVAGGEVGSEEVGVGFVDGGDAFGDEAHYC